MKTLYTLFFSLLMLFSFAQDVIITVSGLLFVTPLELDTINIENLSNGTNLSITNLPAGVFDYEINLSEGIYISMDENQIQNESIQLFSNGFGKTQILLKLKNKQDVFIEVIDLTGKIQKQAKLSCSYGKHLVEVKTNQISIIRVITKKAGKTFKSLGNNLNGNTRINISTISKENNSTYIKHSSSISEFIFTSGDSLKITAIKNNYHSGFIVKVPENLDQYQVYLSTACEGAETLTDYDGNVYNTVQIGNQCWMKENLNTIHYADGTPMVDGTGIPTIDITTKYWFNYNDDPEIAETYGKLYAWAAVMNDEASSNNVPSGVQGVCPNGWHVPSKAEWEILDEKYGGYNVAGGKLKECGYEHWNYPNTGADNQSGFSAFGNGVQITGYYGGFKGNSSFWTSSWYLGTDSYYIMQFYESIENGIYGYQGLQQMGLSIRCVKD